MQTLTPDRHVTVTLDGAESIPVEPFFHRSRTLFEIRDPEAENVEQLVSGVWILKPEATSLFSLHETTAGQTKALRLSEFNVISAMTEVPMQRKLTELPGIAPAGAVSDSGDYFFLKRPSAGASWNQSLTSSDPPLTLPTTPNYPLDTVAVFKGGLHPSDQGYILRWVHPAHPQQYLDYICVFQFGGLLTPAGYGRFALAFGGDGRAYLYEVVGGAWRLVDEWRYAPTEDVPGQPHTVRIIPHCGRWIEIRSNVTEDNHASRPGALQYLPSSGRDRFAGAGIKEFAHLYTIRNRTGLPPYPGNLARPVTGPGAPEFKARRDVTLRFQPALVTYPATGTLTDQPFSIPQVDTSAHVVSVRRFSMVLFHPLTEAPFGSTSAEVLDAATGTALGIGSESWTFGGQAYLLVGYVLPGYPNKIRVKITLTNNNPGGPYSPWFFGYEARKIGESATPTHTPIVIDQRHHRQSPVTRISITGPSADPSHETASLRIADLTGRVTRLETRGEGNIAITTTYDPADQTKTSILFDGYWIKPETRVRGRDASTWPRARWRSFEVVCVGKWKRLVERDYLHQDVLSLAVDLDPSAPPQQGISPPAKITDAIRLLLHQGAGIPEANLDIPNLGIRLWPNQLTGQEALKVLAGVNCGEFALRLARDYINYFLVWDANAGASGLWRLKPVPKGNEPAMWTFVVGSPPSGRLASVVGAYGSESSYVIRETLTEFTLPPENNFVQVTGRVDGDIFTCTARNPKSYNRPGEATADPNHPDYLGRFRPLYRRDDGTLTTKVAVKIVTRRLFDIACRAEHIARFQTPLPLLHAAAFEPTKYPVHARRPPLFGDVVNYGPPGALEKYMVRQCDLDLRKEHHMLASVELVKFNDPLPV